MALSPDKLEELANHLLREDFEDPRKNKSSSMEYPVLSPSQWKRRSSCEIPYSSLSKKQRLECRSKNLEYFASEEE